LARLDLPVCALDRKLTFDRSAGSLRICETSQIPAPHQRLSGTGGIIADCSGRSLQEWRSAM